MYDGLWMISTSVALVFAPFIIWVHNRPRSLARFMQWMSAAIAICSPLIGRVLAERTMGELPQMYDGWKLMVAEMYTGSFAISGFAGHLIWYAVWKSYAVTSADESKWAELGSANGEVATPIPDPTTACIVCGRETSADLSSIRCVTQEESGFVCYEAHSRTSRQKSECAHCGRRIGLMSTKEFVAVFVDQRLYETAVHADCYPAYVLACDSVDFREKMLARFRE